MLKSFLNRAVSFVKKISALLILWVFSMNGKSYKTRQEESMPMTLPEILEDYVATGKYHKYTDTKVPDYIAVVFVA
jgi:surfactin synthase thioesterase subunit